MTVVYIAALWLVALSALWQRRWWLGVAMTAAAAQAVSVALGRTKDAAWLTGPWMWGELAATVAAAALVVVCVARETADVTPFRRLAIRVAAGTTGGAIAGLVWITARYETVYWIFVTSRAKFWLAAAVALALVTVFMPHRVSRETAFTLAIAVTHSVVAPFPNAQPAFRITVIAICVAYLSASLAKYAPQSSGRV